MAFRSRLTSLQPTTTFMSPSSIHHLHAELAVAGLCSDLTHNVNSTTAPGVVATDVDMARLPTLRVQAVEKDGCWFALDSAQLELCRRLERGGICRQVRVDVVSCRELPANVRNLIKTPPPCLAPTTAATTSSATIATSQTMATTSSTLACPVTSPQTVFASAATSNSQLPTRMPSKCNADTCDGIHV